MVSEAKGFEENIWTLIQFRAKAYMSWESAMFHLCIIYF